MDELAMWGRPDGGIEPKDVPWLLTTQVYIMPNSLIACVYHPLPEIALKLRQHLLPLYGAYPAPNAAVALPRGGCRFFQQGHCKKGQDCNFSHDSTVPVGRAPCVFWRRGTCRFGTSCRFQHVGPSGPGMRDRAPATVSTGEPLGNGHSNASNNVPVQTGEPMLDQMFAEMLHIGVKPWEMHMYAQPPMYPPRPSSRSGRKSGHKKRAQQNKGNGDTAAEATSAAATPEPGAAAPADNKDADPVPATQQLPDDSGVVSSATPTATPSPQPQPDAAVAAVE